MAINCYLNQILLWYAVLNYPQIIYVTNLLRILSFLYDGYCRDIWYIQWILSSSYKFIEFIWRQSGQMPLVTIIVVVVHIVVYNLLDPGKFCGLFEL